MSIVIVAMVLAVLMLLPFFGDDTKDITAGGCWDVTKYFTEVDDLDADITHLPHGVAVFTMSDAVDVTETTATGSELWSERHIPYGKSLCFQSKSVDFDVYVGDDCVYSYHPNVPKVYGRGYGKMHHFVNLSMGGSDKLSDVWIRTYSATKDGKSYLKDICFMNAAEYETLQLSRNMPNFLICCFIFLLGLLLVCGGMMLRQDSAGVYMESDKQHRLGIISMGVFAVCASVWSGTETDIMQIITQNPSGVHLLSYVSLMLLPIPVIMFVGALTGFYKHLIVRAICGCTVLNCVGVLISVMAGGPDYHDMLITTHILLVVAIVSDFVLIVLGVTRRTLSRKTAYVVAIAFLVVLVSGLAEIMRYHVVVSGTDTSSVFRLGLLLFVIILSVYELLELRQYARYKDEALIMERLAKTDALTGLFNRVAYNVDISDLASCDNGSGYVVYMDINDLKKVNDTYGHEAGDVYIKTAAEAIRLAFVGGKCYRLGGDEFAVILPVGMRIEILVERLKNECQRLSDENGLCKLLVIAIGYAEYDVGSKDVLHKSLQAALKKADDMMYENKRELKGVEDE